MEEREVERGGGGGIQEEGKKSNWNQDRKMEMRVGGC